MIKHSSLVQLLLCFTLIASTSIENASAEPRPIITIKGVEIFPVQVQDRMVSLLWELGEPGWSEKEISRMLNPVFSYLRAFSGRQFDHTLSALQRGDKYRPMLRHKLKNNKLPIALEALPMVESAYRYDARSNQGAYGLWQFMPATAKQYKLNIDSGIDERKDPVYATISAINYLKNLNKKFGRISILLSIAAYNAGEGRIQGVVNKSGINSKARGYSQIIPFLPEETRGYVPEFLAAALILKDPAFFGFPVSQLHDHQYIQVPKVYSIKKIAKLSKISTKHLFSINPELGKRSRTPAKNFFLRLPNNAANQLHQQIPTIIVWQPATNPVELNYQLKANTQLIYTVRTGNHLGGIADLFKTSIADLKKWNIINDKNLKAGQRIIIHTQTPVLRKFYQIQSGDNLGLIAQNIGVSMTHLKFINGIKNPAQLTVGHRLFYYEQQISSASAADSLNL